MAVVNSENEAEALRTLYFKYGPDSEEGNGLDSETSDEGMFPPETTETLDPANATVHIGFHDRFIEGEYLTVRGK